MDLAPLDQVLWLLSPELALLLASAAVLFLDRGVSRQAERRWPLYVSLAGVAGALVAIATLWSTDRQPLSVLFFDDFALAVSAIVLLAMVPVLLVSDVTLRDHADRQGTFYALLLLAAMAICLLSAATDLTLIVLGFELLGVSSYVLVGTLNDGLRTGEAAIKYFLYSAVLSGLMLYGLSWLYGLAGSTDLDVIAQKLGELQPALRRVALPALILTLAGLASRIVACPFHQWSPDVHEGAPTPVAAFLSVVPVIAGFTVLMRLLLTTMPEDLQGRDVESLTVAWKTLLFALAVLATTVANLVALWQQNVKRFLAYSSVAQTGYLLIGAMAASPLGVMAVLFSLLAYALATLGAFVAVAAWFERTGSHAIEDLAGMHERAPELAWPLLACLLSLAGVPPLAGFFGRVYLFSAVIGEGSRWLAVVAGVNSVISLACYWRVIRATFLAPARAGERLPIPGTLAVALGIAMTGLFASVIFASPLLALFESAAQVLVR